MARRRLTPAAAPLLAVGLALVAGLAAPRPALAADDGLDYRTSATYTLVPEDGVVRVTVDVRATNTTANSVRRTDTEVITTRYYFDGLTFPVQDEAAGVRAVDDGTRLRTRTIERDGYDEVRITFARPIYRGQSASFRVTYDLPGGPPRSSSEVRVGTAFSTFLAWVAGDRATLRVVIPAGFDVETYGSEVEETVADGRTLLRASVDDPSRWSVRVLADRPEALSTDRLPIAGGVGVIVRGWPEDAEWRERVGEVLTEGMPVLRDLVGLSWPVANDLEVREVYTPLLHGYAGTYDTVTDEIDISEDLDELVIIHEAGHAWFNRRLFRERWINEGLADLYAALTLAELGEGSERPFGVSPTHEAAVPLADWGEPTSLDDEDTEARELYGYEASWTVLERIHDEIGDDGMREVLAAAAASTIPYRGDGSPEVVGGFREWRRLLDLVEEVGGAEDVSELFREWVVPERAHAELEKRAEVREAYAALEAAAEGWAVPTGIRRLMTDWRFDQATARIEDAAEVIEQREAVEALAAAEGLEVPEGLEAAFESAGSGLGDARALVDEQLESLETVAAADDAVAAPRDPIVAIGLVGEEPEAGLAAARTAWSAGRLDEAVAAAEGAVATLTAAPDVGRTRVVVAVLALLAVLMLAVLARALVRRRRRVAAAVAGEPGSIGSSDRLDRDQVGLLGADSGDRVEPFGPG